MGLAFWGGLAGAGRGMADVGQQMNVAANERDRQANLDRMNQDRLDAQDRMNQERVDARMAATDAKAGGSGKSGSRSGSGGGLALKDLLQDPELLARATGTTMQNITDVERLTRGDMPTDTQSQERGADGQTDVQVPRYTPGQAADLLKQASEDLYKAVGLTNPGQSDDLAKAQRTAQGTRYAQEYRQGDEYAGNATLINDSKEVNKDGTNVVTGNVTPGSLDAARIKAEGALAAERGQKATTELDKREGKGAIKSEIDSLKERRVGAGQLLNNAQKALDEAVRMGENEAAKNAREQADAARKTMAAIDGELVSLSARLQEKAGVKPKPAAEPAAGPKATPSDARKAEPASAAPPASALKEGVRTTFKNGGGTWTLRNGVVVRVS